MSNKKVSISESSMVSPIFVFFLIHAMQVGVGILGFEKHIVQKVGYDGWISLIISGLLVHIILWMIYSILNNNSHNDIVTVHRKMFGRYIGHFVSMLFSLYFLLLTLEVMRTYIEVVQVWIFPQLNIWFFTLVFILLIYYLVSGGIRTITGIAVISVMIGIPLILLKIFPVQTGDIVATYPSVKHNVSDLLLGVEPSLLSFLGVELLFVYYPFLKHARSSQKWAQFGAFFTLLVYLISMIISFMYFSEEQIKIVTWPTLDLWKIVDFPFLERFEYIGIAVWLFVVLPNCCLALWGATRIPKRIFHIKQKYVLAAFCLVLYLSTCLLNELIEVNHLNDITNRIGVYVLMYIPILWVLKLIFYKVRNNYER
ncbi:GerAB/ArcD/ProY family transporter [Pontibacillus yanchengensis]|nr:GerAB/ArcD/ProY family transporter [Pontibacillus yanchengensis]